MGKRKEKERGRDHTLSSERKKGKKHKKHKKKKDNKVSSVSDNEEIDVVNDDGTKALKLKIKFGGKTLSTTELVSDSGKEDLITNDPDDSHSIQLGDVFDGNSGSDEQDDNEEDKWLDAMEKGELDDTGGLKKNKDLSHMTARQRALHGEKNSDATELIQLPMYPEKTEEEMEEEERRKKLRAKKRQQQLQKQVEETKSQTIEKLLTKSQKSKKIMVKNQQQNIISGPHIRYQNNSNGITLSYSTDAEFPLKKQTIRSVPDLIKCSANGCSNSKKYNCSKTNLPICSLHCYKIVNNAFQNVVMSS